MPTPREEFIQTLADLKQAQENLWTEKLKATFVARLRAELTVGRAKAPSDLHKLSVWIQKDPERKTVYDRLHEEFKTEGTRIAEDQQNQVTAFKERLHELAPLADLSGSQDWTLFETHSFWAFSTQPCKESYAKGAAKVTMLGLQKDGATVKVDFVTDRYEVFIQGDETDVAILRYRPGLTSKEWVKACWGAQINPRVLNPYIPYGFEEKNGLDYFGGEITKAT